MQRVGICIFGIKRMKVRLGDVTKIKTGKLDANAANDEGQYPFFTCSREPLKINTFSYDCECVLVAGNGDINAKYYNGKFDAYQRTYIIEDNGSGRIYMPYLYFFMVGYVEELRKLSIGGVIKYIKLNNLTDAVIELPNIEEQMSIVNVLNKVTSIINKRHRQLGMLNELVKARFVEMFGNENYPKVKASEICDFITKGTTPPINEIYAVNSESRVPFLKVYNLSFTGEMLFEDNPQYIEKSVHEGKLARSKVYPNDILMNIVGPPLGKFAIVTNDYPELNINQAIAIFRAKENVLPRYLLAALMQPKVLQPFINQAVGIRQQNISLEQCRNLEISLPNLRLQEEFVAFSEQVNKSKVAIQSALDQTQQLFDSLMQEYFG